MTVFHPCIDQDLCSGWMRGPTTTDKGQSLGELGQETEEQFKRQERKSAPCDQQTAATYMTDAMIVTIPQWKQVVYFELSNLRRYFDALEAFNHGFQWSTQYSWNDGILKRFR